MAKKADIQSKNIVSPSSPLTCPGVPLCVVWRSPLAPCDGGGELREGRRGAKTLIRAVRGNKIDLRREAGGGGGFERVVEGGGNGYDCTEPFRRGLRCCLGPQMPKNAYFVINACRTRGGDHGAGARPRGWGGGLLCVVCGFCLGCVVGIWLTALSSLDVLL